MKKVLALLLAMLMVVGVFAGCGSKKEESKAEAPESSAAEEEQEEEKEEEAEEGDAEEGEEEEESEPAGEDVADEYGVYADRLPAVDEDVTINVCMEKASQDLGDDENDKWAIKTATADTGIALEWDMLASGTSGEKVPIMLAGGDLPDVFFQLIGASYILQYEDYFVPIEGYFDTYAKHIYEDMQAVDGWEKMAYTPSGHVYSGFQFYQSLYENSGCGIAIINTTWLNAVGKEMPTTWDEYVDVLTAFHDQDANGNGDVSDEIPYGWATNMWCADLYDQNAGKFGVPCNYYNTSTNNARRAFGVVDGTVVATRNTEEYKLYLDVMGEMCKNGLIDPEGFTDGWDELGNKVKNDKVGTYDCWTAFEYMGSEQAANWDTLPFIGYTGVENATDEGCSHRTTAGQTTWVTTTDCEKPTAAIRYWDYLASTPELSIGMAQGEQGTLWDAYEDGSGYYFIIPEATEDMNHENMKYTYGFVNGCPMLTAEETPKNDAAQSETAVTRDRMVDLYDPYMNPESTRIMPSYVPAEAQEELSVFETDVMNAINTFHGTAITEGYTDADWDAYVSQLDSYGYADLIEWYQHAYDADWE